MQITEEQEHHPDTNNACRVGGSEIAYPVPDHRIFIDREVTRPTVQERIRHFEQIPFRAEIRHRVHRRRYRNFVRNAKERTTIRQIAG